MMTKEIKYVCPRCKNSYSSITPIEFCACGSKLMSQDILDALREGFKDVDFTSFSEFFGKKDK